MKAIYIKLIASLFARMREKCFHSRLTSHHQAAAHRRRKSEKWQKIEFHNLILIVLCSLRKNRFNEIELFASENQFHFSPNFISEKLNFKLLNSEHVSQLSYRPLSLETWCQNNFFCVANRMYELVNCHDDVRRKSFIVWCSKASRQREAPFIALTSFTAIMHEV